MQRLHETRGRHRPPGRGVCCGLRVEGLGIWGFKDLGMRGSGFKLETLRDLGSRVEG